MSCQTIDGVAVAAELKAEVAQRAADFLSSQKRKPGLATVLVGSDPASQTYVRMKHRACRDHGLESFEVVLSPTATQSQVETEVTKLAEDPRVDGILVQLPLPDGLDTEAVLARIPVEKDVDGFHPINAGLLARRGCEPYSTPCTPQGCIHLLQRTGIPIAGRTAVVLGRSNLAGLPMALLLLERDATVTVVHSRTPNPEEHTRRADILVAAIGRPGLVTPDMVKPGATVIDIGINKVDDPKAPKGYRLVGDVDPRVADVAGWLTPVPGGVGPMTIAVLLENTVTAAERSLRTTVGATAAVEA